MTSICSQMGSTFLRCFLSVISSSRDWRTTSKSSVLSSMGVLIWPVRDRASIITANRMIHRWIIRTLRLSYLAGLGWYFFFLRKSGFGSGTLPDGDRSMRFRSDGYSSSLIFGLFRSSCWGGSYLCSFSGYIYEIFFFRLFLSERLSIEASLLSCRFFSSSPTSWL